MKKRTNFLLFLFAISFATVELQAQDYQISFAGSGATTTVETVLVQNLSQGTSINLSGTDILQLVGTVSIGQINSNGKNSLQIYPNPTTSNSSIAFDVSSPSLVTVEIFDITGKQVASTQNTLQAGIQAFNVSGLTDGVYAVIAKSNCFVYSGKIISNLNAQGSATISYVNSKTTQENQCLKSTSSLIQMQYTDGDRLLIKATSGNYITVKTLVPTTSTTVTFNFVAATDYDGNNYATVTIGSQIWLAENLRVTQYNDGTAIPTGHTDGDWAALTTGAYSIYPHSSIDGLNSDAEVLEAYGALYNWYAVKTGNLCPTDWRVPTNAEWTTLIDYVGGANVAGGKLKSSRTAPDAHPRWESPNTGATDEYGFSALPGGLRVSSGTFGNVDHFGYWWSSTEYATLPIAWLFHLLYHDSNAHRYQDNKVVGFSVRCLRDL